jgi:iron-sulfur cluster repair protein YtfE (RIC family)
MEEILKAAAPYRMLSEADSLISTVKKVNNNIISTEKESAHQKISNLLEQLKKELKSAGVKEDYFNQAIDPLLDLDQQIESTESVAHLREIPQRAQTIFDEQINKLQEYLKEQTGQGKPKTTVKSIKVIKSSQLTKKEYLETQQDVEEFIERLRKQMTEAVEDNNRIRIE